MSLHVSQVGAAAEAGDFGDFAELTAGAAGRRYAGAQHRTEGKRCHVEKAMNPNSFN